MDVRWFIKFYNRIPTIDARKMLAYLPFVTYPHIIKEQERKKIHARLVRQAKLPKTASQEESASAWARLRNVGVPAKRAEE